MTAFLDRLDETLCAIVAISAGPARRARNERTQKRGCGSREELLRLRASRKRRKMQNPQEKSRPDAGDLVDLLSFARLSISGEDLSRGERTSCNFVLSRSQRNGQFLISIAQACTDVHPVRHAPHVARRDQSAQSLDSRKMTSNSLSSASTDRDLLRDSPQDRPRTSRLSRSRIRPHPRCGVEFPRFGCFGSIRQLLIPSVRLRVPCIIPPLTRSKTAISKDS